MLILTSVQDLKLVLSFPRQENRSFRRVPMENKENILSNGKERHSKTLPKWHSSRIPCFQRICRDCIWGCSQSLKKLHSIYISRQKAIYKSHGHPSCAIKGNIRVSDPPWIEDKNTIIIFFGDASSFLYKLYDLMHTTFILFGKSYWPCR